MGRKVEIFNWSRSWTQHRQCYFETMDELDNRYASVATKYGFVVVHWDMAEDRPFSPYTELVFIHDGRRYCRKFRFRIYKLNYCMTLARRFADEVVSNGDS